jgi:hypothetical protein
MLRAQPLLPAVTSRPTPPQIRIKAPVVRDELLVRHIIEMLLPDGTSLFWFKHGLPPLF